MKVLLTGSFGNVGKNALLELLKKGYDVRCFDLKTKRNEKVERKLRKLVKKQGLNSFETIWGDIRKRETVSVIVQGVDAIVHLAAIIPPLAYAEKQLAYNVNVTGTTMLIEEAETLDPKPHFIYASSIAVHGNRMKYNPPTRVTDPFAPLSYDNYAHHKIIMEKRLHESSLPWTILRFGVVTPFEIELNIPAIMFEIPLDQRIEVVDTRDVGLACANAVMNENVIGKTLFIGGGKDSQVYQREYIRKMLDAMGVGMLPEQAFKQVETVEDFYHCDWMDTEEAEKLLQFQRYSFGDFLSEFKRRRWFVRTVSTVFRPIVRSLLLHKSPYYTKSKTSVRKVEEKENIAFA